MKARLKKKIFNHHLRPKVKYTINQYLYATAGLVLWWHMDNGYDYHISYYCGKITKVKRCPSNPLP